jgi:tetratricopeptide (TPR) repeat protein
MNVRQHYQRLGRAWRSFRWLLRKGASLCQSRVMQATGARGIFAYGAVFAVLLWSPPVATASTYMGTAVCASCHDDQWQAWQGSHHDLAMQRATSANVLGDFDNATFTYGDITSTFFRRDDTYWVRTDNSRGELEDFRVEWVFGVEPLQQLLLPLEGGRLQALAIAWDSRPATEGGQRWYHLNPDEIIVAGDPLHWTGPYLNWNSRCAECHSTDVKKNYDINQDQYRTVFADEDVGCEACHGPGSQHVAQARSMTPNWDSTFGFAMSLKARGLWQRSGDQTIARRSQPLQTNVQIDTCGRCHARRGTLGEYRHGQPLADTHRLAMVEDPLYWSDGQIRDEVYVYGSFVQSKMHQAGVVCSNCHDPHSNQLLAPGNLVCGQCHNPDVFDTPEHHHHSDPEGSQCVSCHMPETLYMGVDWRRDHSMRVPRPDLSLTIGVPNACEQCHTERSPSWALEVLRSWGVDAQDTASHPARSLSMAQHQDLRALPGLHRIIEQTEQTAIIRATALEYLGALNPPELSQTVALMLQSDDPLIRSSAVRATAALSPEQRFLLLRTLIDDPILTVRLDVAMQLADVPPETLRPQDFEALQTLFTEYLGVQAQHLDMPSVQLQLGVFWRSRGEVIRAESHWRTALAQNPQLDAAVINLVDLLRGNDRLDEARDLIEMQIAQSIAPGALWHTLGLLEIRAGHLTVALDALKQAAVLETAGFRHRYVYAIALHDTGAIDAAVALLEQVNRDLPRQPEILSALINYSNERGDYTRSGQYRAQLQSLLRDSGFN